ncbi:MAG TPA: protein TolR [Rhodospirillales bacterium]|nr:MAG: Biopolymer transport protein ExbD [Alphaproteobacteria bacterium MarineAlpha3_Bin6]HHZ75314.1 protein TolR [Rhodospirillales bacterium]HIB22077.1 protein TolR [Rhodospirillales bacterium]HIO38758.1 protein TolR [Rhodospirillales bacterium]
MVTAPNKGARSGRRGRRKRRLPMSDINVTPFVDVMLVLLVVFMVTAPLLTVGVPVDLPKAQASLIQEPDEPLSVSIDFEGRVYVQDSEIALRKLTARLIAVTGANPDIRIFVRGDKTIDYGRVMQVMGTINAAGFKRVALITEMPDRVTLPQKKLNKVAK